MAPPTAASVQQKSMAFVQKTHRADELYDRIAINGHTWPAGISASPLTDIDRRDAAQFVFFEIAAHFEVFAVLMFETEVRSTFGVEPRHARFVMGTIDRGTEGTLGWADPSRLRSRARNIGMSRFHADLVTHVGKQHYDALLIAHKLRNRIAHGPGTNGYPAVVNWCKVPTASRQGCGPGRLLREYPGPGSASSFHLFQAAYREYAAAAIRHLP